jgi:hypothetical protein
MALPNFDTQITSPHPMEEGKFEHISQSMH